MLQAARDAVAMRKAIDDRAPRRFPPPWSVGCFVIRDPAGAYCEDELGRRSAAKLLARGETRPIAANVPKLPELLWRTHRI